MKYHKTKTMVIEKDKTPLAITIGGEITEQAEVTVLIIYPGEPIHTNGSKERTYKEE